MKLEIERKFLVNGNFKEQAVKSQIIKQAFLSDDPKRTVRIRLKDNKGFITIKGESDKAGISRLEFEKEIDFVDAVELLEICKGHIIEKVRYIVPFKGHIFEVDEFEKENKGLVLAEIELKTQHENFEIPEWLSTEVTGNIKYYNSYLSETPYKTWAIEET